MRLSSPQSSVARFLGALVIGAWSLAACSSDNSSLSPDAGSGAPGDGSGSSNGGENGDGGLAADGSSVPPADASAPPAAALWTAPDLPPLDAATVQHVMTLHAAGKTKGNRDDVFTKIGDSITSSPSFLLDLGAKNYSLGDYAALKPTIDAIVKVTFDDNTNSFTRDGNAVQSGLTTRDVVKNLSWITDEVNAIHPAWAIMMFGTDDLEIMESDEFRASYNKVLDTLENAGVVTVISTVPWRPEVQRAEELVPVFNAIIRDIAASRHLPLVDLVRGLDPLPNRGLSSDSVHPSVEMAGDGGSMSADFTAAGLKYGYNVRNLTTVEMFDRLRLLVSGAAPSGSTPSQPASDGGPVTCDAVHNAGCPSGSACMLVNDVTVCTAPGTAKPGQACSNAPGSQTLCSASSVCLDPAFCYQMCSQNSDCNGPSVGPAGNHPYCVPPLNGGSFLLCNIPCNPVAAIGPSGCPSGLACVYQPATAASSSSDALPQVTGCTLGGTGQEGQACDNSTFCGDGLDCLPLGASSGTCRSMCRLGNNADCKKAGTTCTAPPNSSGAWFGFCCPAGGC